MIASLHIYIGLLLSNPISVILKFKERHLALFCVLLCAGFLISLCAIYEPIWQSNDDAGMSMVAHGYGIAAYGVPNLIYSNVVWGYLVRALPTIGGILGYSLATIAVLILAASSMLYFLVRLGVNLFISFISLALLFARPTLFPQFTINAGLLAVAAVIGLHVYLLRRDIFCLIATWILAISGFLIRDLEFFLVFMVALPLLPFRPMFQDKRLHLASILFFAAMLGAFAINWHAYSGQEWFAFNKLKAVIGPYVDYGAGVHLEARPDIFSRYGFTKNDVEMVRSWFFADPTLANPDSLRSMLADLGPLPVQKGNLALGIVALRSLLDFALLPLLLVALILLMLNRAWQLILAWAIFTGTIAILGILGRPGTLHVYLPLIGLLALVPLFTESKKSGKWSWFMAFFLTLIASANFYVLNQEQLTARAASRKTQIEMLSFPSETIVNWGAELAFQNAFPVLSHSDHARHLRLYSLGAFTLAPFSVAAEEERRGHGLLLQMQAPGGIWLIASDHPLDLLRLFCRDHFDGKLNILQPAMTGYSAPLRKVRCEKDAKDLGG